MMSEQRIPYTVGDPGDEQPEGVDPERLLRWKKQRPSTAIPLDAETLGYLRTMLDNHDSPSVVIDDQTVPVFRLYEMLDHIAALEVENERLKDGIWAAVREESDIRRFEDAAGLALGSWRVFAPRTRPSPLPPEHGGSFSVTSGRGEVEVRCERPSCRKLLGLFRPGSSAVIVCPRCKTRNVVHIPKMAA